MTEDELKILNTLTKQLMQCTQDNQTLFSNFDQLCNTYNILAQEFHDFKRNIRYELLDPRISKSTSIVYPKILSYDETLQALLNTNKSMGRFGDGEFACISGNLRAKFTATYFPELADRLKEILHSNNENFMVAIADNYGDLSNYSKQTATEIRNYMTEVVRKEHLSCLDPDKTYYNAYISRPYITSNDPNISAIHFEQWKQLWKNRNLIIIEGEQTRMGIGNDLLSSAASIKRILCPAVDAFSKYSEILSTALEQPEDSLYLIALGPVATVLSYDLSETHRRALDIGHLDLEYEWFLKGNGRCKVPGKYNWEFEDDPIGLADFHDDTYEQQIISKIL